jgi:hypothetical protein
MVPKPNRNQIVKTCHHISAGQRDFPKMTRCRRGLQYLRCGRGGDCIPSRGPGVLLVPITSRRRSAEFHTHLRHMTMELYSHHRASSSFGQVRRNSPSSLTGCPTLHGRQRKWFRTLAGERTVGHFCSTRHMVKATRIPLTGKQQLAQG